VQLLPGLSLELLLFVGRLQLVLVHLTVFAADAASKLGKVEGELLLEGEVDMVCPLDCFYLVSCLRIGPETQTEDGDETVDQASERSQHLHSRHADPYVVQLVLRGTKPCLHDVGLVLLQSNCSLDTRIRLLIELRHCKKAIFHLDLSLLYDQALRMALCFARHGVKLNQIQDWPIVTDLILHLFKRLLLDISLDLNALKIGFKIRSTSIVSRITRLHLDINELAIGAMI